MPVFVWVAVGAVLAAARFSWQGFRAPIDVEVYVQGGRLLLSGQNLYAADVPVTGTELPFTYPPFAAVVFAVVAWLPMPLVIVLHHAGMVACAWLVVRWLRLSPYWLVLMLLLQPSFGSLTFGQINFFLMTLVLADAYGHRPRWLPRGALTGIAAAIKITPAIFLLWFLLRRDTRGLIGMAGAAGLTTSLAAVLKPHDSWYYFTEALWTPARVGDVAYLQNASLQGVLVRMGGGDLVPVVLAVVLIGAGVVIWRCTDAVWSLVLTAGLGLLLSPISWTHHFTWLIVLIALPQCPSWLRWWGLVAMSAGMLLTSNQGILGAFAVAQYPLIVVVSFVITGAGCGASPQRGTTAPETAGC
ncbi:DUF2029 domain-containing protein [Corynebacterium hindlerae]|uniref:DUF2029 domain-containing protein n=1 Tax=Corynebacterium hindlerae TaxID=699041 RepID=A0A7G5FEG2_9CORY|nr:glycosyltransferase 87 family protein [Corynebacterium hindlerae]QMV85003.1 DUF2029 domain-containing protein [Corynebacterium hindlerae]